MQAQLDAARHAQRDWAALHIADRLQIIAQFRQILSERGVALADRIAGAAGRTNSEVLVSELLPVADACRFLERRAKSLLKPRRLGTSGRPFWLASLSTMVCRDAVGVVLILAPFNYPLMLPGIQALQALAAGNAVLFKPGRDGTMAAEAFADLLTEAGLPKGLLQVLGEDAQSGIEAVQADVDKVVLTGSVATGQKVAAALAERTVPAVMELSGNDPVIVLPGARLGMALNAVCYGLSLNKSQTCIAPRRVIAVGEGFEGFRKDLAERVAALPAVALDAALHARLEALLDDARTQGATVHRGKVGDASLFAPTMIEGLDPAHPLVTMDIFAPMTIYLHASDEQTALDLVHRSPYRLGASIFGPARGAEKLARKLDAGAVCINDAIVPTADPRVPFGGRRRSGYGATRGPEGLLEMTHPKVILKRSGGFRPHFDRPWSGDEALFTSYLVAMHGRGFSTRTRATGRMFRQMFGRLLRRD